MTSLAEEIGAGRARLAGGMPRVLGGRYGLSSKEFTPAMARAALDALDDADAPSHFTVGIVDDVSDSSLQVDAGFDRARRDRARRLLRARQRRHREREQELDQDHR